MYNLGSGFTHGMWDLFQENGRNISDVVLIFDVYRK